MLDPDDIDVDEIATALADQTDHEHRWLIDPRTGEVALWTSDTGTDGENSVEIDELDLIPIDPLVLRVVSRHVRLRREHQRPGGRPAPEPFPEGREAFRRFKNQVYERHPELISPWHALRDARAQRRAVEWLLDQGLIHESAAQQLTSDHPDPDLP